MTSPLVEREHLVATGDGWRLHLKETFSPRHLDPNRRPLAIIPGYGMNAFIFGFHPRGTSMERCFAEAGFEVWSLNFRKQGRSYRQRNGAPGASLEALICVDLPAALDAICETTQSQRGDGLVDVIGASLGGTMVYAHLAIARTPRIGSVVAIGAPLTWVKAHPLFRIAFKSERIAGAIRFAGTQKLARLLMPVLARLGLLRMYMNRKLIDLSATGELTKTVEDPQPRINRDLARWLRERDLTVRNVDVRAGLARIDRPLLLVVANRDGMVPEPTALSVRDAWGGADVEVLRIGDRREWYAHADLFVGHDAQRLVFEPIARWLESRHHDG